MYTRVWKCTVIFSWMLNTGPHSCIWGEGASNYLAPALVTFQYIVLAGQSCRILTYPHFFGFPGTSVIHNFYGVFSVSAFNMNSFSILGHCAATSITWRDIVWLLYGFHTLTNLVPKTCRPTRILQKFLWRVPCFLAQVFWKKKKKLAPNRTQLYAVQVSGTQQKLA